MTDGGHVPNEGLPEHLLGGADPLGRPEGVAVPGVAVPGAAVPGVPSAEAGVPGAPLHGVPGMPVPGMPMTGMPMTGMEGLPMAGAPMPGVTVPAQGGEGWAVEHRPAFTFLDQPDQLEDEDDVLLMPGPQGSWGEAVVHGPVETVLVADYPETAMPGGVQSAPVAMADTMALRTLDENALPPLPTQNTGTPVEPSWPPLAPPVPTAGEVTGQGAAGFPGMPGVQGAPEQPGVPVVPVVPQAAAAAAPTAPQPQRRPLHAGPPIPDPSLMTGQVPVRSLADRGPSGQLDPQAFAGRQVPQGSTPAHGVPVVVPPAAAEPQPVAATPVQLPAQEQVPARAPEQVQEQEQVQVQAEEQPVAVEPVAEAPSVDVPLEPAAVAVTPLEAVPAAEAPAETAPADAAPAEAGPAAADAADVLSDVLSADAAPAEAPAVEPSAAPEVAEVPAAETVAVEAQPEETPAAADAAPTPDAPAAEAPVAETPAAEAPVAEASVPVEPAPDAPAADAPVTTALVTDAPVSEAPTSEDTSVDTQSEQAQPTEAPAAQLPAQPEPQPQEAPAAEAPAVTEAQPAEAAEATPATEAPATEAPATEAVATEAAADEAAAPAPAAPEAAAGVDGTPAVDVATEAVVAEAAAVEPSATVEAPAADLPTPEAPAAEAAPADAPAPAAPPAAVPAQPVAPSQPPRRIAAFLADPAPHGLPTVEAAPPAEAAVAPGQTADAAQESAAEPTPETVAGTGDVPSVQTVQTVQTVEAPAQPEPQAAPVPESEAQPTQDPAETEAVIVAETETDEPTGTAAATDAPEAAADAAAAVEEIDRGPAAPGYDVAGRDAVHQVIRERRDIRNGFRPDPIPHEVLIRVLEAAHTAPSVGYSQPWDFVVIRSTKTRRKMHALAERQRDAYAESLPKGRAKQFKEIKIEAILETPVNIVVTADRTRGGRHTLGRHTQPQMAPYSAALAVENLWLAARAEGLGVGWVSFFDEEEMVRELGLPEHLDVVAYLCVGFVDSFPDEPELQQQGWAKKRPLSWVVHEEQYGNRALPGEEPHSVLSETLRGIRPLDAKALGEAWDRQKRMTKPAGSLGLLEIIAAQLSGLSRKCPPPIPEPGCVAIFAGDHGVHAQGVTPWPQEVTAQMVSNFLAGGAVVNAFAAQVGAEVCVVDVGVKSELPDAIQQGRTTGLLPRKVKPGTDDMTQGPAMSREEALKAIEVGIETARDLVAAGNKVLITGDMGIANTTASAALISVFTGIDPAEVTGRGTGIDDATHQHKVEVVRQALALHRPDPADPIGVLSAVGGLEHAAIAGFLLGAASLRTPVILDGVIAGSAALVAKAIAPEVLAACIAGHRSAEPGHEAALTKLGLRPLIDLDLRLGEGTGALLALPLVQSAARAMHDVATFDSAGVTEKA
ncbi:nicotinate-nucleotide--dimethylbenzimidazole phosphoribosyltransferase [Saccharothrix sp. ST-888]|uniref:nicotinate-nucleotide--dimethylbenzimidazole phosphoribosyltransferase n=1 Tax=Saccharothrix sp. ST-888 TaxID=1427391 RepID=UPI00061F364F|nr:nicotinate-nucleotide--dimethylbenzimidazole phosphoribosyltransferase [Saccharothrix sp. ST-888]KJK58211.1 hypothetical protein UK12_11470 [Saccharothrix sp. ST-888]